MLLWSLLQQVSYTIYFKEIDHKFIWLQDKRHKNQFYEDVFSHQFFGSSCVHTSLITNIDLLAPSSLFGKFAIA